MNYLENISKEGHYIYKDIRELIEKNPYIKFAKKSVVFLINWGSGFGSALRIYLENHVLLYKFNDNLVILPHFSENTTHFKYHDEIVNNSFFFYYKTKNIPVIENPKIYFVYSTLHNDIHHYRINFPICENIEYNEQKDIFNRFFALKNTSYVNLYMQKIKRKGLPVIGIHIRSLIQKSLEYHQYNNTSLTDRLKTLKKKLDDCYCLYNVFIATDVKEYIKLSQQIFGFSTVHYFDFIYRVENGSEDSVPQLGHQPGFKYGTDILYDCTALSMCKACYISPSNIPFIIYLMNSNTEMIEY